MLTFRDKFLTTLADAGGKLRHYTRLSGRDGDKIVFCSAFISALDKFLYGIKCTYTPSQKRDFDGFCAFADGGNTLEEYTALDRQLYDEVMNITDKEVCRCPEVSLSL